MNKQTNRSENNSVEAGQTNYCLQAKETISAGIKRMVWEQTDRAIGQLTEGTGENRNNAVHDARKCFKKIRSILRLIRGEIGEDVFRRENILSDPFSPFTQRVFCLWVC